MNISELIAALEKIKTEHGDFEVMKWDNAMGGGFDPVSEVRFGPWGAYESYPSLNEAAGII